MLLVALLIRAFPRTSGAWRHWMWWLVAIAIGLMPLAAVVLPRMPLIPAKWLFGEEAALVFESVRAVPDSVASTGSMSPIVLVLGVWVVGVLWLLFRVLAGFLGLRSFQLGRQPVVSGRLCARMEQCRRGAGVTSTVDLYLSPRSRLPMTWGVLRPAINLPKEAVHWSNERLNAVFMHELGHIRRADCWSNLILRVMCALNWFNPFIWMAANRAYLAQEQACDDFACAQVRASDYARHLLHLAATIEDHPRERVSPVAVGFLSGAQLKVRLTAALDPRRHRHALPNRVAGIMSFAVVNVAVVAAMMSFHVEESYARAVEFRPSGDEPLSSIVAFDRSLKMAQKRAEIAGWQILWHRQDRCRQ